MTSSHLVTDLKSFTSCHIDFNHFLDTRWQFSALLNFGTFLLKKHFKLFLFSFRLFYQYSYFFIHCSIFNFYFCNLTTLKRLQVF